MSKDNEEPTEGTPAAEESQRTPKETARELGKALRKHAAEDPINQMRRRKP